MKNKQGSINNISFNTDKNKINIVNNLHANQSIRTYNKPFQEDTFRTETKKNQIIRTTSIPEDD